MTDPMMTLRDEIVAAIDRYRAERTVIEGKIAALDEILGTMDEIVEAGPAADSAVPERFGTGRAPRRDIKGTILKVIRDRAETSGVRVELPDICRGAGILLDGEVSESAARRAIDALVRDGELLARGEGYIPNQPHTAPVADAAK